MTRTDPITVAQRALKQAESAIRQGERARDEASDQLDEALAARGWRRLVGAFTQDAEPFYVHKLYPNATLRRAEAIEVLTEQRAAA